MLHTNHRIQAVHFDWNGTLLDDLDVTYRIMTEIFQRFGLPPPTLEEFRNNISGGFQSFYHERGIPRHLTRNDIRTMWADGVRRHWGEVRLRDGAREAVTACKALDCRTTIVSAEHPELFKARIEELRIRHLFDEVRCDVWPKDNAFEELGALLGVPMHAMAYLDDFPDGLIAAKRKGLVTIGFMDGYASRDQIERAAPDFFVNSLSEIPLIVARAAT